MKLNLGCGANKLEGYINVDANADLKPDKVLILGKDKLPFETESIEEIVSSHTIEHIPRQLHFDLFNEINRVLKVNGELFVSFPDFERAAKAYLENNQGKKDLWEQVIFGRRLDMWDSHVCAMIPRDFANFLKECGFKDIRIAYEQPEGSYCLVHAVKGFTLRDKSDVLRREVIDDARV